MGRVQLGLEDDELATVPADNGLTLIPVEQIQGNPENPRPQDVVVDETAANLRDQGQIHNVNVMTLAAFIERKPYLESKLTDAPYVVINGNLRLLAARKAGLASLKAAIRDEWTENQIDEAVVSENEHRARVNHLLLGQHLARMLPRYNNSHRQLAESLNKTQPWVSQHVGLTKLHPDLQAEVLAETLPFKLTRECTRLHPDLQPLLAAGTLSKEVATAWLLEERIKPADQMKRWEAGPPYLLNDSAPVQAEPVKVAESPEPPAKDAPAQPRPIVIRIGQWSASSMVTTLRKTLTEDQWDELVKEISTTA